MVYKSKKTKYMRFRLGEESYYPAGDGNSGSLTEGFDIQATIQLDNLLSKENVNKKEPLLCMGSFLLQR